MTLRADRLTACPAVPGPSDSLFDTLAESGAPPGTSAAGRQTAYPASVGPPPPASVEGEEQMREWGRQSGKERERDRAKEGKREKH